MSHGPEDCNGGHGCGPTPAECACPCHFDSEPDDVEDYDYEVLGEEPWEREERRERAADERAGE